MLYSNRDIVVESSFGVALMGEFRPRVARGEIHTLARLVRLAYNTGSRRPDTSAPQPDYAPPRVSYMNNLPWMAGVELCVSGYEQADYRMQRTDFSLDVVRLRLGDKRLTITKDYDALVHDGALPHAPRLRLDGVPSEWDQSIHMLPLDEESLPLVSKVVADAALRFVDDFEW